MTVTWPAAVVWSVTIATIGLVASVTVWQIFSIGRTGSALVAGGRLNLRNAIHADDERPHADTLVTDRPGILLGILGVSAPERMDRVEGSA